MNILNGFPKSMRFINDSMLPIIHTFQSNFVSAYREHYSANHVLMSLENWKKNLDNNEIGAVFMDLSKIFDSIPRDLLLAKMEPCGFIEDFLTFLYSYLKRRKQSVSLNNVHNMFEILLSAIPKGSILGPLLFRIFISDLFYFIKDAQLLNFANDDTIATFSNSVDDLLVEPQKESGRAIDWFRSNEIVVNPKEFQSIIINALGKLKDSYKLQIHSHENDLKPL